MTRRDLRWRIQRLTNRYEEWLCDRRWSPNWLFVPDQVNHALCVVFGGHEPIEDHCGMPEHDYCAICQARTPNGAAEERAQRLHWIEEIRRFRADPAYQLEPKIEVHLVRLYGSLEAARRQGGSR
jgi:hypothetical protein